MDNQNTNGLNENNNVGQNVNPVETPNPNLEGASVAGATPAATEQTPVAKPTLDSILNSSNESMVQQTSTQTIQPESAFPFETQNQETATPVAEPEQLVSSVESTVQPVTQSTVLETTNMNTESQTEQSAPSIVIETIPEDTIMPAEVSTEPSGTQNESVTEVLEAPTPTTAEIAATIAAPTEPVAEMSSTPQSTPVEEMPDDFNAVPVPPTFTEEDKKKKTKQPKEKKEKTNGNKTSLIIVLIVILIGAIGFGIYYFLKIAKSSATSISVVTKDLKLELGSTLPHNITEYATISGYDMNSCELDISSVNMAKVGSYKYHIICGKSTTDGIIMVDDTTAPEVITNDVVLLPNSTLNVEDFIDKCLDASICTYKFENDSENLTAKVGEYEVPIIVTDEYNNKTTVNAKLTISTNAPVKYMTCMTQGENVEEISANLIDKYKIGIDANDNFHSAVRISEFSFQDAESYGNVENSYNPATGIHNIIGTESFDKNNQKVTIKSSKDYEAMKQEISPNLPNNANVMKAWLSGLGYTCQ